jgi:hypothetical protein
MERKAVTMRSRAFLGHLFLFYLSYHFLAAGLVGADYYGYESWWAAMGLIGIIGLFIYLGKFMIWVRSIYRWIFPV